MLFFDGSLQVLNNNIFRAKKSVKKAVLSGISEALNELKGLTGREFFAASHCYGYRKK